MGDGKKKDDAYQSVYYAKNKEKLQAKKAQRYAEEETYKEEALARSKRQYWVTVRPKTKKALAETEISDLKSVGKIPIEVSNKKDKRHGKTVRVDVFPIDAVGLLLGRSAQTITLWENKGVLPAPFYRGGHWKSFCTFEKVTRQPRLYTRDEVTVLAENRYLLDLPSRSLEESPFAKKLNDEFALMRQGLVVRPK